MAGRVAQQTEPAGARASRRTVAADQWPDEVLGPILAGAYARGMADTLELMQVPALFIGPDGRVLYDNGPARRMLGRGLRLESQHLVADEADDNRALSDLLAEVVRRRSAQARSVAVVGGALTVHAVPFGDRLAGSGQLVKAVLVIDAGMDAVLGAIIERMVAMRPDEGQGWSNRNKSVDGAASPQ